MIQQGVSAGESSSDPNGTGGMSIGRVMDYIEARLEAIKSREDEEDEDVDEAGMAKLMEALGEDGLDDFAQEQLRVLADDSEDEGEDDGQDCGEEDGAVSGEEDDEDEPLLHHSHTHALDHGHVHHGHALDHSAHVSHAEEVTIGRRRQIVGILVRPLSPVFAVRFES